MDHKIGGANAGLGHKVAMRDVNSIPSLDKSQKTLKVALGLNLYKYLTIHRICNTIQIDYFVQTVGVCVACRSAFLTEMSNR